MKKLSLILLLFTSLNLVAQNNNKDRIQALKVAFITERLDLTPKEAQEFWPVYNKYVENSKKIKRNELKEIHNNFRANSATISDAEADKLLDKLNKSQTQLYNLHLDFDQKVSKIISSKKIILLKIAEKDFKHEMFEEYKKRR